MRLIKIYKNVLYIVDVNITVNSFSHQSLIVHWYSLDSIRLILFVQFKVGDCNLKNK